MSKEDTEKYFESLNRGINLAYAVASEARKMGHDPVDSVEIPIARNMAERVVGLITAIAPQIKDSGVVDRIQELEKEYGNQDWRVALKIAEEVAKEKFCKFKNKIESMEVGIRVGIAYVTNGVVASPLEGFTHLKIRKRRDGKEYFALFFSGPIRSAGGTGASVSVLIGDYIRKIMGYDKYDPTEIEINRVMTEIRDYHERITNLQYFPSEQELKFMLENVPVQIDGDPSEKLSVSNYKGLDRMETDKLRNGVCLVLAEGLTQKAPKVWKQLDKWGKDFQMDDWFFMEKFLKIQKQAKALQKEDKDKSKIKPDFTYIKDLVAGRPVLGHPLRTGAFRLRYGRSRNAGLSSASIHPATMAILNEYLAVGTQLKWERPSKGTAISSCDTIEGPIVKLFNGSVLMLNSFEKAKQVAKDVEEIIFLGDVLVPYGDFLNRAHPLVPCGYNEEWWRLEFNKEIKSKGIVELADELNIDKEYLKEFFKNKYLPIGFDIALKFSKKLGVPMHPRWTYHFKDINKKDFLSLIDWFETMSVKRDDNKLNKIILPLVKDTQKLFDKPDPKRVLELLGVPHLVASNEYAVIEGDDAKAFAFAFGFLEKDIDDDLLKHIGRNMDDDILKVINKISNIKYRDKSGTFIGSRMGRPEKAKIRKLTGSPHVLFPVGEEGGRLRSFQEAIAKGKITGDFPIYFCENCNNETIYGVCENCNKKTEKRYYSRKTDSLVSEIPSDGDNQSYLPYRKRSIDIRSIFEKNLKKLGLRNYPDLIKGVRGTSNEDHTPENLVKGILRAYHDIQVNKDGTVRYDMTELSITHFKPLDIGTSIEKLKEMGYEKDIYGKELVDKTQILELKVQDLILPGCEDSFEKGADEILFRVAKFVDDLLVRLYGMDPFYNLKSKEDLAGHLILCLAPHISAGMTGRIIGFSKTQGFFAHPYFHCAIRRDCDGDEAAIMLMMDALLNFSRKYLPGHRGARQDAPLVMTSVLIPGEVDDMVFDMDIASEYPLELYESAEEYKNPWEVKIETIKDRLGKDEQFFGMGFTHDVSDINKAILVSAYKKLPTMMEKVWGQMDIAEKIRAVDESDVARLVIERHFMRDIKGNLRKFSQQEFRCVGCNEKFRRPPLMGVCTRCHGKIIFTIAHGGIIKYMEPALSLAEKYDLPPYLRQDLELTQKRIESVFSKDKDKQEGLGKWFG